MWTVDRLKLDAKAVTAISLQFIPVLRQQMKSYLLHAAGNTETLPNLNFDLSAHDFLLFFTSRLRYELRNTNVSVSVLSTALTSLEAVHPGSMEGLVRRPAARFDGSLDALAEIAIEGMFKGTAEIFPGGTCRLKASLPDSFANQLLNNGSENFALSNKRSNKPHYNGKYGMSPETCRILNG